MSAIIAKAKALNLPKTKTWISEAEFGFKFISEEVSNLACEANVLEVGCGIGLLLAALAESFSKINFEGLEPFNDGFSALEELKALTQNNDLNIQKTGYESYAHKKKFDLIYCVNVFEHVDDWRHMLDWVSAHLKGGGKFFVLCPNYSFPYESHFKLPIIINKNITYKVFKGSIQRFEFVNDAKNLWKSLNFVKKKEVKRYIAATQLSFIDDVSIIDHMIDRVLSDKEFRDRQKFIGFIAVLLKKVGALHLLKAFPNFLPYMQLSFVKKEQ